MTTSRPKKVRQVYRELRNAVGLSVPSYQLLRLAAALVEASEGRSRDTGFRLVGGRRPREEVAVDQAMADGGWRVMEAERNWVRELFSDEEPHRTANTSNQFIEDLAA